MADWASRHRREIQTWAAFRRAPGNWLMFWPILLLIEQVEWLVSFEAVVLRHAVGEWWGAVMRHKVELTILLFLFPGALAVYYFGFGDADADQAIAEQAMTPVLIGLAGLGALLGVALAISIVRAPSKVHYTRLRELSERVDTLTDTVTTFVTPRLEVTLNPPDERGGDSWVTLMVNNPSGKTVHRCYGRIESYRCLDTGAGDRNTPRPGTRLLWGRHSGSGLEEDIADFAILDVAVRRGNATTPFFFTPTRREGEGYYDTRHDSFGLRAGNYEAIILVGSLGDEPCPTERVKVSIAYDSGEGGGLSATVTQLAARTVGSPPSAV